MSILIPKGANDSINSREEFFKEKEEHIKKQKREKFISDKLVAAGMRYNYTKKQFEYKHKNPDHSVFITFDDFEGATEEQIAIIADAYKEYIQNSKYL